MTNSDGADYSVRARFDELCRQLRQPELQGLLERPLGYWALAGDRRLPYALLERPLRELIRTPFGELARTPGIGKKKMASLVVLLERGFQSNGPVAAPVASQDDSFRPQTFNYSEVAEAHWEAWRKSVTRFGLSDFPLGRFAPALTALPSVIWQTPLSTYLNATLGEIREMKAHGDKRLRGIVEVIFHIDATVGGLRSARHLAVVLRPAFAPAMEQWIVESIGGEDSPTEAELRQNVVLPLLNQLQLDGGETVGQLAAGRLGLEGEPESVIVQAERLEVTRARVYQLLEVCAEIMAVRWPEGRRYFELLSQRLMVLPDNDRRRQWTRTLQHLCFPTKALSATDERLELETVAL